MENALNLQVGASTYHKGVDIGAPEGFEFIAVTDGIITFVGFLGGGGYTITLTDKIVKGQIIGKVGPKYVDRCSSEIDIQIALGKKTNGATTGPHLHFGMRINGEYVNPLNYIHY